MIKKNNLKKNILDKINKGDVKMKPRIYFTIKAILLSVVIVTIIVLMAFLVSFVAFSIKESSRLFLLGFGGVGISVFFATFPWFLFAIEIILLFFVDVFLRYFRFAYRTPFMYLVSGTGLFVIFFSIFISATPVHETLYQEVVEQKLPIFKNMYLNVKRPPHEKGVFRGVVTSVDDDMFTLFNYDKDDDNDDGYRSIFIPKDKLKYILSTTRIGDFVLAACSKKEDNRCYLYGIKNFGQVTLK